MDLGTARFVQEIINNIGPFLQKIVDCPSKHPNNLDAHPGPVNGGLVEQGSVQHYRKACSNFIVNLASSARGDKQGVPDPGGGQAVDFSQTGVLINQAAA